MTADTCQAPTYWCYRFVMPADAIQERFAPDASVSVRRRRREPGFREHRGLDAARASSATGSRTTTVSGVGTRGGAAGCRRIAAHDACGREASTQSRHRLERCLRCARGIARPLCIDDCSAARARVPSNDSMRCSAKRPLTCASSATGPISSGWGGRDSAIRRSRSYGLSCGARPTCYRRATQRACECAPDRTAGGSTSIEAGMGSGVGAR